MRLLNTLAIAATLIFASSCSDNGATKISGKVTAEVDNIPVSIINPDGTQPLDTLRVEDGKFGQNLSIDSADFLLLRVTDNYTVPLFVKPGEKIELNLTGSAEDPLYEVSGSEESERILRITKIRSEAFKEIDSLNTLSQEAQGTENYEQRKEELDAVFQEVIKSTQKRYKEMIAEQPGSIANIFIFSQSIGNFPLISPQEDFKYFEMVDSALAVDYPTLRHTKNFREGIAQVRESLAMQEQMGKVKAGLAAGKMVPDIELAGPNGEVKKLSDLRGKLVLVDFWAAWCRPCRAQNPFLVKLYNDYKDQGFTVYSVSLDGLPQQQNPKEAWTAAIEQDGLVWDHHVSDLKGWDSEVVMDFGFNGIPFTVLVDKEGTIIATELRGPDLEAKVKEVLGS